MGSGRAKSFAAIAVAALLLATVSVLVAAAAPKRATGHKPAAARVMNYACAWDLYNAKKVLHFVGRPSSCRGSGRKLVRWNRDYPVLTCRKEHGGFARGKRFQFPNGVYSHGPAGLMRLVSSLSQCAPKSQRNETPLVFPLTKHDQMFCAAKRGGELRWIPNSSNCDRREFKVRLKKVVGNSGTPGGPPDPAAPVANPDSANTDEDHGTTINVLANDRNTATSHSNAGLQIASIDTSGTRGSVSVNPDGTIAYSPNGQFEQLQVGQTGNDVFKYRVKRGTHTSAPAVVIIQVGGVNDLPVARDDTATTDSAHTKSIQVLANDTDADGDPLSVSVDTSGTQGNVTVNGDGTVTYDPNHKFDSLNPGDTAHDTFKYKANDGHGDSNLATVDVTINGIDDPPVVNVTAPATHYTEGDPATVVDSGVTVSDPDSANLQSAQIKIVDGLNFNDVLHLPNPPDPVPPAPGGITAFYDTNAGVLSLTAPPGGASKADWQAALRTVTFQSASDNPFPVKKLEFTINDGNSDSAVSTKTITTTNINDAPQVQASSGTSDFVEDSPPVAVDPAIDVSDPDSLQLQGATVAITSNFSSADGDTLSFTDQNGITGSYNSATGILTLSGAAAVSDYQTAIQSVTFSNTSNTPSTATRTVSIKVTDAEGADSNTDTKDVTVTAHNDAPVAAADGPYSTNEDTPLSITAPGVLGNDSDAEGNAITAVLDTGPAHASSFTLNSDGSFDYTPAPDYCGPDSFTYHDNDGTDDGNTTTVSLTVNCVNDAPVVDLNGTGTAGIDNTAAFTEDQPAVAVAPAADVTDVDNGNLASATITLTNHPDGTAESLAVDTSGTSITASAYNSGTGVLTLSGSDTVAHYQAVIRSLTYDNSSNTPDTTNRVVNVTVNDGSVDSATAKSTISVTAHNDAPVATGDAYATDEDVPMSVVAPGVLGNDSDPEGSAITAVLDSGPTHASSFTLNSDGSFDYTPSPNYNGPDSFTYHANDGSADSSTVTVGITINPVNDAPVTDLNGSGTGGIDTTAAFTEDSGAVNVAPAADVTDIDSTNLASATITLFNHPDGVAESLAVDTTGTSITASSYDSGTGVLTLSGSDTVAHYQAVIRSLTYNNTSNAPDTTDRTVTVKVNDGSLDSTTAKSTISVTPHNDAPVAVADGPYNTSEDTLLTVAAPGVLGNDSDPEGSVITAVLDSGPSHASSFTLNSDGSFDYTPAPDYFGPDSFTYHANDGSADSGTVTVSLSVTAVNDAPVVDLDTASPGTGSTTTFNEVTTHDNSVQVAPNAGVTDIDDANIESGSITLTNRPDGNAESLAVDTTGTSITASSYDSSTGVITLSGTDTKAHYQQVIQSLRYSNTAAPPNAADRHIDVKVNDGDVDSATATATVQVVPIDVPPVVDLNGGGPGIDNNASFTEDQPAVAIAPSATVTDADDPNLVSATVTLTNKPDGAAESLTADTTGTSISTTGYNSTTGVLSLSGTDTTAHYQQVIRSVKYDNTSNTPDPTTRDVTVKVNDGQADSLTATSHVSVTPHNDAPTLDLNGAGAGSNETASYTEDQPAVTLAPNTLAADVDDANLQSATITLTNHPDGAAESLSVDTSGTSISAVAYNSGTGVLSLSGSDTVAHYEQVLRTVKYLNTSQNADATNRVVNFVVNDGSSDSNSPTTTVTITVVNDPPVVDMNGGGGGIDSNAAFVEDSAPANPGSGPVNLGASATVSDVDNASLTGATLTLTNHPDGASESLSVNVAGTSISTSGYNASTGVLTLTGTDTTAHYQQVIQSAQYNNVSNTPDPTNRDITTKVNDGTADSTVAHTTVSVTPTNDAPTAGADTFNSTNSAIGNTTLNVNDTATTGAGAGDGRPPTPDPTDTSPVTDRPHKEITGNIFANDSDPESSSSNLTATPGTFATNDGGTVTIQSDGDFNFEPAPSTSCTDHSDFFNYTVNDNDPSGDATATGTVTIAITGCVWYVNNNDAQGNSGTSEKPFDTLAQAQTASATSDSIFVYDGDDNTTGYNAGISLKANQKLLSEAADLIIGSDTLHSADAANKASLTNNNADVVSLNNGTTVKGFNIDPQGTGGGICGGTACGGNATASSTLDDISIVDNGTKGTQAGLELNGTTGTFDISNLTVNNGDGSAATSADEGVRLNNAGTVNFASAGTISITTNGAAGFHSSGTNLGTASTFDDITVTNSGSGGVDMGSNTGSGTSFGNLSLTTTQGSFSGFSVQTGGSFSIASGGTDNVSATGGPAVAVANSSGSTMAWDDVSSTNSAGDAIHLDGLGTGTFSATTGTIGGEAGTGFYLNGGSGAITYPGTFNNGSGALVAQVTGRTGGVVSLSGSMNDTNDAGGGVNIASNTGGSTVFSGATKQFNTGASDAVTFSNSDGHTFVLSGGGTDIDTTSGNGINATTSGTFQVSGSGNTIDSTALGASNRALNIVNTDLAAAGVTFQHISSSGGTNGIQLNTTGSSGTFTITGTGTAGSGGTITAASGPNVLLTSMGQNASFDRMNITSGGDDGIRANSVGTSAGNGISLSNSSITNNGNAVGENGIDYTDVLGISSITSTTASGSGEHNALITGNAGTERLTVSSSTFSSNSTTTGGDGLQIDPLGTSAIRALVQNSTFSANRDDGFQLLANVGDASTDLEFNNNTVHAAGNAGAVSAHAGLNFDTGGTTDTRMSMSGGTVDGADGSAIIINPAGNDSNPAAGISSTFDGSFDNVTVGTQGVAGSGSATGLGMWIKPVRNTDAAIKVTNSHINGTGQFGVQFIHNDGQGNSDFTFTGNTIRNVGTGNEPLWVQAGSLNTDVINTCADIGGTGGDNTNPPGNDFAGQASGGVTDVGFRRPSAAASSHLKLPGFDGNAANLQSYIQGRNVGNPTVANFSGALEAGPASCQQPIAPTAP